MFNGLLVGLFSWIEYKSHLFVHIEKRPGGAVRRGILFVGAWCLLYPVQSRHRL